MAGAFSLNQLFPIYSFTTESYFLRSYVTFLFLTLKNWRSITFQIQPFPSPILSTAVNYRIKASVLKNYVYFVLHKIKRK